MRFDFTGLGKSEGDFSSTTFSTEVGDLVAAAQFLEREYEAPRLLIGHSLGGAAVLAAAASIPSTTAVVTIAAPFDPADLRRLLGVSTEQIEQSGQATVSIGGREFTIRKCLLERPGVSATGRNPAAAQSGTIGAALPPGPGPAP